MSHWSDSALCAQIGPELFFPPRGSSAASAKQICARCPVRNPCQEEAIAHGEQYGIWGGISTVQIGRIRAQRGAA